MSSFNTLIQPLLLPPGLFFVMLVLGLLLRPLCKKFSRLLVFSAVVLLYLGSTPLVSQWLLHSLQVYPALDLQEIAQAPLQPQAPRAIVILGGGREPAAPEYGQDTLSIESLVRSRYGAWLQQRTGLPILVTGGIVNPEHNISEASLMAEVLEQEYRLMPIWQEPESRNTFENAQYSSAILKQQGIEHVYLVTHAWHMPRAVEAFHRFGIRVTPAPTRFTPLAEWEPESFLPSENMQNLSYAFHEYLGILWYRLHYYKQNPFAGLLSHFPATGNAPSDNPDSPDESPAH